MSARCCPKCGVKLPEEAREGLCPGCLLAAGLAETGTANDSRGALDDIDEELLPENLQRDLPELEIGELIGRGGMGVVYKARQKSLDRTVALKVLLPKFKDEVALAERFGREARTLARLQHPNIVALYDFGRAGARWYFVMEYVDGVDIRHALRDGKVTPEQTLEIIPHICDALQYAHGEGVVHRDIKPENVLIDRKGRVKIADFGLARILTPRENDVSLTGTRDVMGTPQYMAPEQFSRPGQVDHRADIYALGVVFYEMLTGELPMGRFAPPSHKVQVDVRLDEIVLRSLEHEPERRYQMASEVKADVESVAGSPSPVPERAAAAEADPITKNGVRRLLAMAGFLAVILAVMAPSFLGRIPKDALTLDMARALWPAATGAMCGIAVVWLTCQLRPTENLWYSVWLFLGTLPVGLAMRDKSLVLFSAGGLLGVASAITMVWVKRHIQSATSPRLRTALWYAVMACLAGVVVSFAMQDSLLARLCAALTALGALAIVKLNVAKASTATADSAFGTRPQMPVDAGAHPYRKLLNKLWPQAHSTALATDTAQANRKSAESTPAQPKTMTVICAVLTVITLANALKGAAQERVTVNALMYAVSAAGLGVYWVAPYVKRESNPRLRVALWCFYVLGIAALIVPLAIRAIYD